MGRPKGSKNAKKAKELNPVVVAPKTESVETVKAEKTKSETITEVIESAKNEKKEALQIKKQIIEPLGEGQQYFEAPDGTILIGEESATRLWYRAGSMWINPKREASAPR